MQALVNTENGLELQSVKQPILKNSWVTIKVKYAGLCHSDLSILHRTMKLNVRTPTILGHEFFGEIWDIGKDVSGLSGIQLVSAETAIETCGWCQFCQDGSYNICKEKHILGYWHNGCFAEYVTVPARNIVAIPSNVSPKSAVMLEPLACCVHAVGQTEFIDSSKLIIVVGAGSIGQMIAQITNSLECDTMLVGTPESQHRLDIAKKLGLFTVLNNSENITHLYNLADIVFECSGTESGFNLALTLARRRGKVIQVGLPNNINFDGSIIARKELEVVGSLGSIRRDWSESVILLETGRVKTEPLVTDIYQIDQWQGAFSNFEQGKGLKHIFSFV